MNTHASQNLLLARLLVLLALALALALAWLDDGRMCKRTCGGWMLPDLCHSGLNDTVRWMA